MGSHVDEFIMSMKAMGARTRVCVYGQQPVVSYARAKVKGNICVPSDAGARQRALQFVRQNMGMHATA